MKVYGGRLRIGAAWMIIRVWPAVYDFSITPVLRLQSAGRNLAFFVDLEWGCTP